MRAEYLPFCLPLLGQEEIDEVVDTLKSGWLTTGPKTRRFEEAVALHVGAAHALGVSSCTAALHLALAALDVGPGDEVILPTMTFAATANVVVHVGATPILVDITPDTYNMDPDAVEAAITPRTRAIIAVHFAGQPCDLDRLQAIADRHGAVLIEDAAHAIGAHWRGRPVGSTSRAACFSFYPIKNMTTGEGGMLVTSDPVLEERARRLSLHGMSRDAWKRYSGSGSWFYEVVEAGFKYNMTDLEASLGIHQLARLEAWTGLREAYARRYDAAFADRFTVPYVDPRVRHARHLYPLLVEGDRDGFIEGLRERNIGTTVNFIPLHRHPFYRERLGLRPEAFPNAEWYYARTVSLPLYPKMTEADIDDVVAAVLEVSGREALVRGELRAP
ncbi:MAG: DegT/DnrJ/EryC1/StrS aminotransferase family protein [Armatimonadetes bacterium]|nr:DegT/DnrJ/EryC1/StrS aminotransferase family protein [Armatimonadota bacterium]